MGKSDTGIRACAPACRDLQRALPLLPAHLRILRAASASLPATWTASLTAATGAVLAAARRRPIPYAALPSPDVTHTRPETGRPCREWHCP
ncbi:MULTISPECIES: hypothetical protein [Streptomyces]|uniref:hypothetical protein n=1 Tax=Streptomyces TaxID=1883 RepID=UPI0006995851|nr:MULTISPECIES: hypothetical protein [Streptomyces]MYU56947.1 hypothetical protein [Streptomyces sp. SID7805]